MVFGGPTFAAVLERDVSDVWRMMSSSRSATDATYVEITLFLHGNLDLISEDILEKPVNGKNSAKSGFPDDCPILCRSWPGLLGTSAQWT